MHQQKGAARLRPQRTAHLNRFAKSDLSPPAGMRVRGREQTWRSRRHPAPQREGLLPLRDQARGGRLGRADRGVPLGGRGRAPGRAARRARGAAPTRPTTSSQGRRKDHADWLAAGYVPLNRNDGAFSGIPAMAQPHHDSCCVEAGAGAPANSCGHRPLREKCIQSLRLFQLPPQLHPASANASVTTSPSTIMPGRTLSRAV